MNRDTPKTDAALELASDPDGAREVCDLCECLERELNAERLLADELASVLKRWSNTDAANQVLAKWKEARQ